MYVDIPTFKKCCFCIPLRHGLLVYGYFKVVLMGLLMVSGLIIMALYFTNSVNVIDFTLSLILVALTSIDLIMNIIFLRAAHSKNWKLFKIYYRYYIGYTIINMISYCACAAIEIFILGDFRTNNPGALLDFVIWTGVIGFIHCAILVYIILLLRSELIKLQNNCDFRFVNKTQEAECVLNVNNGQGFIC